MLKKITTYAKREVTLTYLTFTAIVVLAGFVGSLIA